jgi:O-antigen/teichoic acid export membrane protein
MHTLNRLRSAANRELLVNAGSMIGTTVVTSGLGFVYWWVAARQFPAEAVGFASAAISAMSLIGTIGIVGLGTLLIGELSRQPGQRGSLITTALLVSGLLSSLLGGVFALVAPVVSEEFQPLAGDFARIGLFVLGVALTAITLVLDQALIGLLRGGLQLWRNGIFALVKLAALLPLSWWLADTTGLGIYTTWTIGNLVSLLGLAGIALMLRIRWRARRPQWSVLRDLPGAALGHHALNLALQLPGFALPIVVTALLSAALNASFYMAWLMLHLVFAIPYTLTTVLYAVGVADRGAFAQKMRLTLSLATAIGLLSNIVLWLGADQIMGLFGPSYAAEAAWALRIMGLGVFPLIVKDHYVVMQRVHGRIPATAAWIALSSLLELLFAALGAQLHGLYGLSVGFAIALYVEGLLMARVVYQAASAEAAWQALGKPSPVVSNR